MEETEFQKLMNQIRGLNVGQQFNQGVQNNSALMGSAPLSQVMPSSTTSSASNTTGALGAAGMASGNPFLMAAGLGLQLIGGLRSSKAEKEKQREQERQNYIQNVIGRLRV